MGQGRVGSSTSLCSYRSLAENRGCCVITYTVLCARVGLPRVCERRLALRQRRRCHI
jgi:hypothetical protein